MDISLVSCKLVKEDVKRYPELNRGINSAKSVRDIAVTLFDLENEPREIFGLLCLDTRNNLNNASIVAIGNLNTSVVHPREIFRTAILSSSNSIIVFHNHPSGDPSPSKEDIEISKAIKKAGELIGIALLDHVVIGHNGEYHSLADKGEL
jgi:DNA repair protein RadC